MNILLRIDGYMMIGVLGPLVDISGVKLHEDFEWVILDDFWPLWLLFMAFFVGVFFLTASQLFSMSLLNA